MVISKILKHISQVPRLSEWLLEKSWESLFDARTLARGLDYSHHAVDSVEIKHLSGTLIFTAEIQGSQLYETSILITSSSSGESFRVADNICSCPVFSHCKHAASLLYWLSDLVSKNLSNELNLGLSAPTPEPQLAQETANWLKKIASINNQSEQAPKKPNNTILTYCLEPCSLSSPRAQKYLLYLRPARLYQSGEIDIKDQETRLSPPEFPKYVTKEHKVSALRYWGLRSQRWTEPEASGEEYGSIILHALESNSLFLQNISGPLDYSLLKQGPSLEAQLAWTTEHSGTSYPNVQLSSPETHFLPTDPPLYLNPTTSEIGLVISQESPELLSSWFEGPPLDPEQTALVANSLISSKSPSAPALPPPVQLQKTKISPKSLKPILHICSAKTLRWHEEEEISARLFFQYKDSPRFPPLTSREPNEQTWTTESEIKSVNRNKKAEHTFAKALLRTGLEPICEFFPQRDITPECKNSYLLDFYEQPPSLTWLLWLNENRSTLEKQGWTIEIDSNCNLQFHDLNDFQPEIGETPEHGIDWFDFKITSDINGQPLNLIPYIADFIAHADLNPSPENLPEFFILPHPEDPNQYIRFSAKRFLEICRSIAHLFQGREIDDSNLTISRLDAASVAYELEIDTSKTTKALAQLGKNLSSLTELPKKNPPKSFQAELRPYQLDGFRWLHFLASHQLNGILADDMGLGKTVQTLAFLSSLPRSGKNALPSLIVAPTSVIANWSLEAERFAPNLKALLLQGTERKENFDKIKKHHLVLTSYPLLHRDRDILLSQDWKAVILDEAQYIKNPKTNAAQVAGQLSSQHRFCLSGTPMENHLGELWSLMNFAMPGYLGNQKTFNSQVRRPIENQQDTSVQHSLNRRLAPLLLRRTKDEVAQDLPPKTEIIHPIALSKKESDLYESVRATMDKRVRDALATKGLAKSHIIILDALLKLRQICCHPSLLKTASAKKISAASKMNFLTNELLPELLAENRRILLFSQFTSILSLIEGELKKSKVDYLKLTGQTKNRASLVKQFQNEDIPIFLISLKAGGTGLTLTAADTVIHYDPWWNPAAENQATDRAHRIGQTKPVFVHKLICQGSIEEHIQALQKHKANLVKNLLSEETTKLKIDTETLSQLFEPLA